jgi:hypothetical protein
MVETINAFKILLCKSEGRHWHRREDNIKMVLRERVFEGVNWIHLDDGDFWWALVNKVMDLLVP